MNREADMNTRRDFLKRGTAAGIVFCGCGMMDAARAQQPGAQRVPVTLNGKRVKTIDVHAHCHFREAVALTGEEESRILPRTKGSLEHYIVVEQRLKGMDAQAIDMEVLSINPFWYRRERDLAAKIVEVQNEKLAELCASRPDRFAAFASLALQFPDLAVQQLETALKKQGLRGAAIGGSVLGEDFSEPKFHPVWAEADELGAVLFIHPQSTPDLARRFKGNGWLANTIGNPLDTTIALQHLIFEGTLDRFPRLKICSAHGGGFLPSYAPRSDNSLRVAPDMDTGVKLKKKPTEYLKQMYYDTLVFTSEALRHLAAEVGVNRLVVGTDHPIPWQDKSIDHILKAPGFSNAERRMMLGETAAKLLGIKL